MPRYYLLMLEDGHILPIGKPFDDLEAAKKKALGCVDDALPHNRILVTEQVASAYFGGDGGSYLTDPTPEQRLREAAPALLAAVKHFVAVCDENGYCKRGKPPHNEDSPPLAAAKAAIALAEQPS